MNIRTIALLALGSTVILGQDAHHNEVERRGDHIMGFSHEKTTHHFRLFTGGAPLR